MSEFRVIQGCPCNAMLAPYVAIVVTDAGAVLRSIFRGDSARAILNAHGKHSQQQLVDATPAQRAAWGIEGTPNPAGHSTHELRSDGVAYPMFASGSPIPWWAQGFDVDDAHVDAVIQQANSHRWRIWRPYPAGVEFHHLNFHERPRPTPMTLARIVRLRATLPRH